MKSEQKCAKVCKSFQKSPNFKIFIPLQNISIFITQLHPLIIHPLVLYPSNQRKEIFIWDGDSARASFRELRPLRVQSRRLTLHQHLQKFIFRLFFCCRGDCGEGGALLVHSGALGGHD
jgi:hypothetical protein